MKKVLVASVLVFLVVLTVAPVSAAPKSGRFNVSAPNQPNSEIDFYEKLTGQRNPYAPTGPGEIEPEYYPPLDPDEYFYYERYVPYWYSQGDSRWRNDVMQTEGYTIGQAGCALTSATMVFRKWGVSKDPHYFNIAMGNYACPFYWYTACSLAGEGLVRVDYTNFPGGPMSDQNWYNMAYALKFGYVPIVELVRPDGRTHWVVVYKVAGHFLDPASYRIIDPNGGYARPLTDYTTGESAYLESLVIYAPQY